MVIYISFKFKMTLFTCSTCLVLTERHILKNKPIIDSTLPWRYKGELFWRSLDLTPLPRDQINQRHQHEFNESSQLLGVLETRLYLEEVLQSFVHWGCGRSFIKRGSSFPLQPTQRAHLQHTNMCISQILWVIRLHKQFTFFFFTLDPRISGFF